MKSCVYSFRSFFISGKLFLIVVIELRLISSCSNLRFLSLISLAKGWPILLIFQIMNFWFYWLYYFPIPCFINSHYNLYYFISSSCFRVSFFLFSSSFLQQRVRWLLWGLFSFLMWTWTAINFPLSTVVTVSQKSWYFVFSFSFISRYFLIFRMNSLICWSGKSMLFKLHVFLPLFHRVRKQYFHPLQCIQVCLLGQHVVPLGECSMGPWKGCTSFGCCL